MQNEKLTKLYYVNLPIEVKFLHKSFKLKVVRFVTENNFQSKISGVRTMILQERPLDSSKDGFHKWKFMSVHSWGEKPAGTWKVKVRDMVSGILQLPLGTM